MSVLQGFVGLIVLHVFMVGINAIPGKHTTKGWTAVDVLFTLAVSMFFVGGALALGAKTSATSPSHVALLLFGFGVVDVIVAVVLRHHRKFKAQSVK